MSEAVPCCSKMVNCQWSFKEVFLCLVIVVGVISAIFMIAVPNFHASSHPVDVGSVMPPIPLVTTTSTAYRPVGTPTNLISTKLIAPSPVYVCNPSRLGNKMFLLAAVISKAVARNKTFTWLKPSDKCLWVKKLESIFPNLDSFPAVSTSEAITWREVKSTKILKSFFADPIALASEKVTIGGFCHSWKYFRTPAEQQAVRKLFTFSTYYEEHVQKVFTTIYSIYSHLKNPILVGLHMRLGDLLKPAVAKGKTVAEQPFYNTVFKKVETHFNKSENLIFVASSDSPDVGKQKLEDVKKLYNIYWLNGTDLEDFATLSRCNHSIISGGTFGFWTAWLAGGETFYNGNFAEKGSQFAKSYVQEEFNLPRWKPVFWK